MPIASSQFQHRERHGTYDLALGDSHQLDPRPAQVRPDDVEVGLLLFFKRPSMLQTWAEFFGHEWRHVGVTVATDDGVRIATYGPKVGFRVDDPVDVLPNYTRVAAARVYSSDDEIERLGSWLAVDERLRRNLTDAPYVVSAPLIGPIHLIARRSSSRLIAWLLMLIVNLYCAIQNRRHHDRAAFVCSTFIWAALQASMHSPLRVPLTSHPDDEVAYARAVQPDDVRLGRWLCGPTELWNAIAPLNRWEVDLADWATS